MKLYPLGSVLEYGEEKVVVVGHKLEKETGINYICVMYPYGYMTYEGLISIPVEEDNRVVSLGLECNEYMEALENVFNDINQLGLEESEKLMNEYKKFLRKNMEVTS